MLIVHQQLCRSAERAQMADSMFKLNHVDFDYGVVQ